jgi:heat shock transcription factor
MGICERHTHRRKPVHSHSLPNQQGQANASPLSESERHSLKEEIERLRHEKDQLRLGHSRPAFGGERK